MNIFITGVTGFIGGSLAGYLSGIGWDVHGSSHDEARLAPFKDLLKTGCVIDFDSPVPPAAFSSCDAVIHCAHDISPNSVDKNITGTRSVFEAAEKSGVPHQVFISSHSARADAASEYGIIKHELEGFFLSKDQTITRPGLVIGNGGLFMRQYHRLKKMSVVPLPGSGRAPVPIVGMDDLNKSLKQIVERHMKGAFNLFYANSPDLRGFVEAVNTVAGHRALLVNIPTGWLFDLLRLMERLKLPTPRMLDRLKTMHLNQALEIHYSNMEVFLPSEPELTDVFRLYVG